ncbi:MAG: hypothetical protein K8S27_14345 [Candidatus Omnitrophica bacterium]|nr:hypothetical protein [Candidatus Omnitrophota bacterium]
MKNRKQLWWMKLLLLPLALSLSGCIYLIVGGVGAVGGYIVSPDTVEGITDFGDITIWESAVEIVSIMGIISDQNEEAGLLIAKVNGAKVTITVMPIDSAKSKLTVKARKAFMPKINLAQDIFVKIVNNVRGKLN